MLLEDRVAIVTGGARGIGRATALKFAEEGCSVAIADISIKEADDTASEIVKLSREGMAVQCNAADNRQVSDLIRKVVDKFGKIDILVNNAGISDRHTPAIRVTDQYWDEVIGTDLTSVFHFCREALKYMVQAQEGVIVNVSSIGGVYGNAGASYSAAKAGVIGLTKNIAIQYAGTRIRCNAVCPGPTPTELNTPEQLAKFDQEFMEICARHTDHSVGDSEVIDQANAILFLASDESRYITGQSLVVDRGMCL